MITSPHSSPRSSLVLRNKKNIYNREYTTSKNVASTKENLAPESLLGSDHSIHGKIVLEFFKGLASNLVSICRHFREAITHYKLYEATIVCKATTFCEATTVGEATTTVGEATPVCEAVTVQPKVRKF